MAVGHAFLSPGGRVSSHTRSRRFAIPVGIRDSAVVSDSEKASIVVELGFDGQPPV